MTCSEAPCIECITVLNYHYLKRSVYESRRLVLCGRLMVESFVALDTV
jgi:hypothetical protein